MPELPDVEGLRRLVAATAAGRQVRAVQVPAREILRNTTPQALGRALGGRWLGEPRRHGKWLFIPALGPSARTGGHPGTAAPAGAGRPLAGRPAGRGDWVLLLMHFGMDGTLRWTRSPGGAGGHDRLIVRCGGGELRYRSVRKLGGVWLAAGWAAAEAVTGPLGPDALGLSRDQLAARLCRRRGAIKPALMDQSCVAGLGNLTVDETLWRARLHPRAPARLLGRERLGTLHRAMSEVLAESVPAGRVPDARGWLAAARGRRAGACPRCGAGLARDRVGGRGTVWCPRCQPWPGAGPGRRP